jgi:drug/metabolite transporter (DMT)-like permease
MEQRPDGKTYAAFAGAVLIGGANFIAVSFSNRELPPLFGATLRFALGALLFYAIAWAWRVPMARGTGAKGAAAYGLMGFGAAYALLYYALVGLAAGTTAVIVAAVPLFTLAIAVALRQERFSLRGVAGGLLVVAGIAALSRGGLGGDGGGPYLLAAVLGAVAIATSSTIARTCRGVHPVSMNAIGMTMGTALLAISSLVAGESWALPRQGPTLLAVGYLVTLGSVGLFQLFLYVIRRLTASATVYAVATMPVVAVALGAVMLDQPITREVVAGGAMVMAAVYVGIIAGARALPSVAPPEGGRQTS